MEKGACQQLFQKPACLFCALGVEVNEATATAKAAGVLPNAKTFTQTNPFSATSAAAASALVGKTEAASSSKTTVNGRRLNTVPIVRRGPFASISELYGMPAGNNTGVGMRRVWVAC
jgi:hypothetical protein